MQFFNKFMNWYHGNNEKEKIAPKTGMKRVLYLLWNYPGKLIGINVLFILGCLPVLTIPASINALHYYCVRMFRDGYGVEYVDFWREWKVNGKRSLIPGGIFSVILFYGYYLMSLAGNFNAGMAHDITFGIGLAVFMCGIIIASYFFVLASMLSLSNRQLAKNSVYFLILEWKSDLLILLSIGCMIIVTLLTGLIGAFLMGLIGFASLSLIICAIINPTVERRILLPYEKTKR